MTTEARNRDESDGQIQLLCLIPPELSGELLEPLRRHYREVGVEVEVTEERRRGERRSGRERRKRDKGPPKRTKDRRLIRNADGRRVGERRARLVPIDPPAELPRTARPYADQILFYERVANSEEHAEDLDTARLITRIQAGDRALSTALYERYFDRVYAYMRVLVRDFHEAEDATQEVLVKAFEALESYERRSQPFRAWLFTIARNVGVSNLRKHGRVDLEEPGEVIRLRDRASDCVDDADLGVGWLSDRELLIFVDRLPLAQRQVLVLRFMLDMTTAEIAQVLGSTEVQVRKLQHRALAFLRERFAAVGRRSSRSSRGGRALSWRRRPTQVRVLRDRRFALLR